MANQKRVKMKRNSSNKGQLVPWLLTALNKQLYKGLKWKDRQREIFCIHWTHKSAEQWSKSDLEPFIAWAAHKGKLEGKNEKQLKATFRCALNSKKELKEVYRTRDKRFWQFVDPKSTEKDCTSKRKRKVNSVHLDAMLSVTPSESALADGQSSLGIISSDKAEISRPPKLPAFESSFLPLTPPHQANEISYNFTESEFSEEDTNRKEIFRFSPDLVDRITSSISPSNMSNSLSSPGSSCEEYLTNYTPPPDHSRLSPPQKNYHTSHNSFHPSGKDVYQPNCWTTTPQAHQDPSTLNQFFSKDFIEMYKYMNQEFDNNNSSSMDFLEMDQYVPVMGASHYDQTPYRNGQHNFTNKTERANDQLEQMKLDDVDLLSGDVDQEECERLMLELDRLSPSSESRLYNYNS